MCLKLVMAATTAKERVMAGYSYATVETALARVFGADATAQKRAFRGRLQHLRRCGLPASSGEGRGGKTIPYTDLLVCSLLVALELEEAGIAPVLAVRLITGQVGPGRESEGWKNYLPKIIQAARSSQGGDDDVILMVEPYFMSAAWGHADVQSGKIDPVTFRHKRLSEIKEFLDSYLRWHHPRRFSALFNLSERLKALDAALKAVLEEKDEAP